MLVQAKPIRGSRSTSLLPRLYSRSETIGNSWYDSLVPLLAEGADSPSARHTVHRLTEQIIALLLDDPLDVLEAQRIGARLAERFCEATVLGKSQQVLPTLLLAEARPAQLALLQPRLAALLGEMAIGFIEERERALQRAHRTFLSHMRHELGTPLTAITSFSYIILEGMDGPLTEPLTKDVRAIQDAGQHVIDILNDVSDLSKIDMGRLRVQPRTFELLPLVEEAVRGVQDVLSKNGNCLTVEVDPALGSLHSDKKKVERLLRHLLSHANWSTRQGSISLKATREKSAENGSWIVLTVADTGVGMSPYQLDQLQQPCRDTEFASALEMGGVGLGLLLCRRFCEMLGGSVEVRSHVGQGTRYTIHLPAENPPPSPLSWPLTRGTGHACPLFV